MEDGYAHLELAYDTFLAWSEIPDGDALDVGHDWMFHGVQVLKNRWTYRLPRCEEEYSNYMHIFTGHEDFLCRVMTMPQHWNGFDRVRTEERYLAVLEKAKALAEKR